jgi:uncharacterized iron-regulated membrane protein
MKSFRTALFWLHLLSGVIAGVVILIMSATGAVLALKPQIQDWIERDVRQVTPQASAPLGADQLLAAVKAAKPEASPLSLTLNRDPGAAAVVSLGRDGSVYINPYTGAVLGPGSARTAGFFQSMTTWHRYLGASGDRRATGRSLTGISNLAFLVLAVSGLYIWWPRQFTRQHLKPITWFRRSATGRARDFNWHNTIGFWCAIPIAIMTISGAVLSYTWASDLVYRLTGSPVPSARGPARESGAQAGGAREGAGAKEAPAPAVDFDRIWTRAQQQVPTWTIMSMRLPTRPGAPVTFTITDGANWNAFARSNLTLNGQTGEVLQWQPYEGNTLGQKARGWLRFAHTGELGGLTGQIIAGVGCVGGVFLVYTGMALAFRRLWQWVLGRRLASRRKRETSGLGAARAEW